MSTVLPPAPVRLRTCGGEWAGMCCDLTYGHATKRHISISGDTGRIGSWGDGVDHWERAE